MARPALPLGRRLPWVLGAAGLALLAYGLATGSEGSIVIGALGLAGTFVGFILPRLLLGNDD